MKTALVDLVSDALALGYLLKVTRRDGVIARYTTHDRDVAVGGATYSAGLSDLPSALQARSTLAVDNVTVDWLLDSDVVSKADLPTGLWDDATVEVWVFDTDDLSVTPLKVFKGAVGEIGAVHMRISLRLLQEKEPRDKSSGGGLSFGRGSTRVAERNGTLEIVGPWNPHHGRWQVGSADRTDGIPTEDRI